jgi:hypothetical protein
VHGEYGERDDYGDYGVHGEHGEHGEYGEYGVCCTIPFSHGLRSPLDAFTSTVYREYSV